MMMMMVVVVMMMIKMTNRLKLGKRFQNVT